MRHEDWIGVWMNELHADYLARDRLAEARMRAAGYALVAGARGTQREARISAEPRRGKRWRLLMKVVVAALRARVAHHPPR